MDLRSVAAARPKLLLQNIPNRHQHRARRVLLDLSNPQSQPSRSRSRNRKPPSLHQEQHPQHRIPLSRRIKISPSNPRSPSNSKHLSLHQHQHQQKRSPISLRIKISLSSPRSPRNRSRSRNRNPPGQERNRQLELPVARYLNLQPYHQAGEGLPDLISLRGGEKYDARVHPGGRVRTIFLSSPGTSLRFVSSVDRGTWIGFVGRTGV